jgi:D-alanyl-D-alanine carboxypeptidase
MNADGSEPCCLTDSAGMDRHPSWSADGTRIAFVERVLGPLEPTAAGSAPMSRNVRNERPYDRLAMAGSAFAELGAFVDSLASRDRFSGAVLVARDGAVLFARAFGLASRGFGVPNRVETRFNLGSMNKMFTGVAIAQLAERGLLAFGQPAASFLQAPPSAVSDGKVTVHQLLTHTSGLGSYFQSERFAASWTRLRAVEDYLPLLADEECAFEPGTGWQYSNSGYLLLGAVVERVSGRSYFDYVREQVFRPAGMTATDSDELDLDPPNTAIGYTREEDRLRSNLFSHVIRGGPAGGGFSTVEDLLRFERALLGHRLLAPETTELVLEGKVDCDPVLGGRYGYGFLERRLDGARVVGHFGGYAGISTALDIYPELGWTVVVLANADPPVADEVATRARELILARAAA